MKKLIIVIIISVISCRDAKSNNFKKVNGETIQTLPKSKSNNSINIKVVNTDLFQNFIDRLNVNSKKFEGDFISNILHYPLIIKAEEEHKYENYQDFRYTDFFHNSFLSTINFKKEKNNQGGYLISAYSEELQEYIYFVVVLKSKKYLIKEIHIPTGSTDEPGEGYYKAKKTNFKRNLKVKNEKMRFFLDKLNKSINDFKEEELKKYIKFPLKLIDGNSSYNITLNELFGQSGGPYYYKHLATIKYLSGKHGYNDIDGLILYDNITISDRSSSKCVKLKILIKKTAESFKLRGIISSSCN